MRVSRQWQNGRILVAQWAPRLASLLFTLLILAEGGRVVRALLSKQPLVEPYRLEKKQQGETRIDVQTIVRAHLFGISDKIFPESKAASTTIDNFLLQGTVTTESPTRGVAILSKAGAVKVLMVGDEIGGGTLRAVYVDHVNLNYEGKLISVALPLRQGTVKQSTAAIDAFSLLDDESPQGIVVLGDAIRASASIDEVSNHLRGFLIEPSKVRRVFYHFGLRDKDLVISINGASVVDEDSARSQQVLDTMLHSSQSVITVVRAGASQEIVLDAAHAGSRL
jgi:type II secretion system protein C